MIIRNYFSNETDQLLFGLSFVIPEKKITQLFDLEPKIMNLHVSVCVHDSFCKYMHGHAYKYHKFKYHLQKMFKDLCVQPNIQDFMC